MWSIIKIEKLTQNFILTESSNIDWVDKSIIDISNLKEIMFSIEQIVMVVDKIEGSILKIKIKDIDLTKHHIVFGEKRWVPLHKL